MTQLGNLNLKSAAPLAALLIPLLTVLLLCWHSLSDRDVWFHQRAGSDLLAEGSLVQTNRYSYTAADHPWLNHEWLFQAAIAATAPEMPPPPGDPVRGWSMLRLLLGGSLLIALLGGDGLRRADPGRAVLIALITSGALALLWTRLTLRPELVSYLLLPAVVRAIEQALARPGASWRRLDPREPAGRAVLLVLIWAQCHGFAALAVALWLLGAAGTLLTRRDGDGPGARATVPAALAWGLGATLAALMLTPNGPAGLLQPLRALAQFGGDRPDLAETIAELVPLLQSRDALGGTIAVFKISLVWSALWCLSQWGRVSLLRVALVVLTALATLKAQRALGLYAVAFVLLHTGTAWPLRLPARLAPRPRLARLLVGVGGLLLVGGSVAWWATLASDRFYLSEGVVRRFGAGLTPAHAPQGSLAALGAPAGSRLLTNVDAAGYALATTEARVFIDGRTEAYPPELWRSYADLRAGGPAAGAVLNRYGADAVCLAYGSGAFSPLVRQLHAAPDWTLAAVDGAAALFLPRPGGEESHLAGAAAARLLRQADSPALGSARRADLCLAAARTLQLFGLDGAPAALARGLELRPDHPLLLHNRGNTLLAAGRFAEARASFLAALAVNHRQAGSALNAGVCAMRLGDAAAAAEDFERSVGIDPRRFAAWMNLAAARRRLGDEPGARRALERAAALRPDDPAPRNLLRSG